MFIDTYNSPEIIPSSGFCMYKFYIKYYQYLKIGLKMIQLLISTFRTLEIGNKV